MAVKKDPKPTVKAAGKSAGNKFLADKPGSRSSVPTGLFYDAPGNNTKTEGGIGIDLPGGGRFGLSLGNSAEIPGLGRVGYGADIRRVGRKARTPLGAVTEDEQVQAPSQMTFADYLAMANEMTTGDGADYSALKAQLRANGAEGDAKLAAMYNQLRGSIDADAGGIGQNYDSARTAIVDNGQAAAQQTNAGFDRAREAQTQQLAALGIGDAAAVLAGAGGNAANDQAVANSGIAQRQQIGGDQAVQNKASALNYNTGVGNAAGLEGAVQRAGLQQQLANKLAELETAETESQAGQKSSTFERALQLAGNASLIDPNYQAPLSDQLEQRLLAGKVTAQDLKNQALAANSGGGTVPNLTQLQSIAQQMGVDPSDQDAMIKLADYLKTVGGLTF